MEEPQQQEQSVQNKRMEKVFKNYLEMDTSYALLMNGPRGIGKTFFSAFVGVLHLQIVVMHLVSYKIPFEFLDILKNVLKTGFFYFKVFL